VSVIAAISSWDWTEIAEGILVSIAFVLIPVLWHAENRHRKREREAERRHQEQMEAHRATARQMGALG
jgi:predicted outer membrane lipoprotein